MPPRTDYPNHLKLYRYGLCRIAYRKGGRNGCRHVGTRRAENNTRQRHNDTYLPERRISRVPQRSYQPYRSDPAPAGQCRTGTQDRKEPSKGVACHALRKPRRYEAYPAGRTVGCLGQGFLRLAAKDLRKGKRCVGSPASGRENTTYTRDRRADHTGRTQKGQAGAGEERPKRKENLSH